MRKIFIDSNNIDYSLINDAADILMKGGVVALPTETVYGLGVHSEKREAVDKLYELKNRPREKPFTSVIDDVGKVSSNYFGILPPFGYRLMEKFWPGPLTIIYYSPQNKKIGIRVPSHAVVCEIIKKVNAAIYLPSANTMGEKEAVSALEVEKTFYDKIDLIVDSGPSLYSKPSTVADLTCYPFKVLREGVVSQDDIIDVFVRRRILFVCTGNSCRSPMAQFLFKKYLEELRPYLIDRFDIISRGIATYNGLKAAPHVVDILREEEGIDISSFASQKIDRQIILSSDLIFTMEDRQTDYILNHEPTAEGRVFSLKKFLTPDLEQDIPDPIGSSREIYGDVYYLIKKAILELREWI